MTKEASSWRIVAVTTASDAIKQRCQNKVGIALAVATWRSESSNFPISVSDMFCFLRIAARTLVICDTSGSRSCLAE